LERCGAAVQCEKPIEELDRDTPFTATAIPRLTSRVRRETDSNSNHDDENGLFVVVDDDDDCNISSGRYLS
jgi:hypothetical protein